MIQLFLSVCFSIAILGMQEETFLALEDVFTQKMQQSFSAYDLHI